MTQNFSLDLRVRVSGFIEAGHSCRAAARHFGVSDSCAIKLMQRQRQSGSLAPARQGRRPGRGKLMGYETFLVRIVEAEPAITMPELAARLLDEHGIVAAPAMLSRKGERLRASTPFGHWKTHTFIAGLRCHELSALREIDARSPGLRSTPTFRRNGRRR